MATYTPQYMRRPTTTGGTSTPNPHPSSKTSPSSSPPLVMFQRVTKIIRDYEWAKRQHDEDPHNQAKYTAFIDSANKVDIVWYHYNTGDLTPECYVLVDLFVTMWMWDSDLLRTPFECPAGMY